MGFGSGFGKSFISATRFRPIVLGGGGGVTAPSLQVGLTLDETSGTLEFEIVNNDGSNPSGLELAFSLNALEAVSWDDGTASSPSFALDPASTREISFTRGSGAPEIGDAPVVETITATLADGSTVTQTVTVEAQAVFKSLIAALAPPTHEFLMDVTDGTYLVNTGTEGGSQPQNARLTNCSPTVDAVDGFDGYLEMNSATDDIRTHSAIGRDTVVRKSGTPRSWIWVWDNQTALDPSEDIISIGSAQTTNTGCGWIRTSTSNTLKSQYNGSAVDFTAANATHSSGGTAMDCGIGSGIRTVLAVTYDGGTSTTIRWKQTGHASGHTYITQATTADSTSGNDNFYWCGFFHSAANTVRYRYMCIIDHQVSLSEFDSLASSAGL